MRRRRLLLEKALELKDPPLQKRDCCKKTFTEVEQKELLAGKANDNIFLVNDNGIYMFKGKVVNGESFEVVGETSNVIEGNSSSFMKISNSNLKYANKKKR